MGASTWASGSQVWNGNNGPPSHAGLATITDGLSHTTNENMDLRGRQVAETDPLGDHQTWQRNADGLVTQYADGNGNATGYDYDSFGDMTLQENPDGGSTTIGYDSTFHLPSSTRTATGTTYITTSEGYDSYGEPTKSVDGNGQTATMAWSSSHLLTRTTVGSPGTELEFAL